MFNRPDSAGARGNYATDIALLLTFLWGRGKAWTNAVERDLDDYEHWRRFARENPNRVGGSKWDRELAAFTSLYRLAVGHGHMAQSPVTTRQVRNRNGDVVTVAAARAKDSRSSNVHWLTPRIASAQSGARLFQLWNPQCSCALGGIKSIISIPTSEVMKTPRIAPRRGLSLRMPSQTHIATLISQRTPSPRYVIVLAFPCASAQ